jgi:hypothetical protein
VGKAPRLGFFNWRDDMKWTLVVLLATLASCGGDSKTPREQLIGNWLYTNGSGSAGVGLTFDAKGSYVFSGMQEVSSTSLNAEVEQGLYSATDTAITFTAQKYTCAGPVPIYTLTYDFSGDILSLLYPSMVLAFSRNTASGASVAIILGCFQSDGSFVQSPLAPVSN